MYVAGITGSSTEIATVGAFQIALSSGTDPNAQDGFLAKFSPDGSLLWGTYFGTTGEDYVSILELDNSGNIIIGGHATLGSGNLSSPNAFQTQSNQSQGNVPNAFVAKFTPTGQRLWCTYYGNGSPGSISDIKCDENNFIYVFGQTMDNTGFYSTIGSFQNNSAGNYDCFITKFSPDGSSRIWSTYYGGSGREWSGSLLLKDNSLFVAGQTLSTNNISSTGSYQENPGGAIDVFIL